MPLAGAGRGVRPRAQRARAAAVLACLLVPGPAAFAANADAPKPAATALTATQIVAKNAAARGGLDAWRKVETMVWTGHLESEHTPAPSMPFLLDQKRPNKTRFELHAMSDHSVRAFDGAQGWKSHSGADGRANVKPYTTDENRYASSEHVIDGPLIDLEAKGGSATLAGAEQLEGHKVYHLIVHLASGDREDVWVDARTFLDVKVARVAHAPNGAPRTVPTLYRDFKTFEGLKLPTAIQIGDGTTGPPDRMQIERVALNMDLDDRLFVKPGAPTRHKGTAMTAAPADAAALPPPGAPAPDGLVPPHSQR